ncbi:MAG: peptidylprolyl isomerase [Sedimentisphaerales bacterium]|nr:peptidylprolyl isomerase [Sedimentisphaerales bacterium]
MKKSAYIRQAFAFLMIVSVLIVSGCKKKDMKPSDGNTVIDTGQRRSLDKIIKFADPNEVAATVNDFKIREGRVQEILNPEIANIKEAMKNGEEMPSDAIITQHIKDRREMVLQQLIIEQLLDEKVKDLNIVVTTEEADELLKKQLSEQSLSMADFKETLEKNNISYNELLEEVKKERIYQKFMDQQMEGKVNVSEEDAKKYYDENIKAFDRPEQVRASHILVAASRDEPNDVRQKARAKIEDMLRQVKEGADFAELAKANPDATASTGGDLDYFSKGRMVEEFEKPAFELSVGQVSDVVETEYGYHIIKVTDHKEAGVIPFDEVKEDLTKALSNREKSEFTSKYIESLIKEAAIKFPEGKEIKLELSGQ